MEPWHACIWIFTHSMMMEAQAGFTEIRNDVPLHVHCFVACDSLHALSVMVSSKATSSCTLWFPRLHAHTIKETHLFICTWMRHAYKHISPDTDSNTIIMVQEIEDKLLRGNRAKPIIGQGLGRLTPCTVDTVPWWLLCGCRTIGYVSVFSQLFQKEEWNKHLKNDVWSAPEWIGALWLPDIAGTAPNICGCYFCLFVCLFVFVFLQDSPIWTKTLVC